MPYIFRRLRAYVFIPFLAISLALASASVWAERDALVSEAASYLRAQKPKLAYDLLLPHETKRSGDPDFDFVFGAAASQIGEYTKAIMSLERAVDNQPNNTRAIAELGKAYYAVRDNERAKAMFKRALVQGVPVEAGKAINQFITDIELANNNDNHKPSTLNAQNYSKFSYGGRVGISFGQDSNVGRAPSQTEFYLPRLRRTATLNKKARKRKSTYTSLNAGLSGRYTFNQNWAWIGHIGFSTNNNQAQDSKRNNVENVSLSTGAVYYKERHELKLQFDTSLSRLKDGYSSHSKNIGASWTYHIDGFRRFTTSFDHGTTHHAKAPHSDSNRHALNFSYAQTLRSGHYWYSSLYFSKTNPKLRERKDLKSDTWGLRVGGQYYFNSKLSLSSTIGYDERSHGGKDFFYGIARKDKQINLDTSLNWAVRDNIVISPALSFSKSESNVKYHSFDRQALSISAGYTF